MKRAFLPAVALAMATSAFAAPQVAVIKAPNGIMQVSGAAPETDSLTLANGGSDAASITLVANGGFFTVSPSSFTLAPGATMTVTITPTTTAGGFRSGNIGVFVAGAVNPIAVPVRMFAGVQPVGIVSPLPSQNTLVISGLAGTQHPGTWNVTNLGNVTMQGMLTPDVPWIVPQGDIVNIAPQRSAQLPFVTDPNLRDAITPLGAIVTHIGMLYLKGTAPAALQSGEVGATVVDISKVSVVPAQPPDPAANEVISFLPLVGDTGAFFSDIFFANRGAIALPSDLKLFYTQAGSPAATSLFADAGPLAAGIAAWFPLAPSSLFNVANQSGTVQMRVPGATDVAIAMLRGIVPDGVNRYLTSMPVLRSDRAIASGDRLIFAGVEKSATAHTDIVVQEVAASGGTYQVDFFDASGTPLAPSKNGSILPFGSVTISDAAPAGARSARLTNTSGNAARLTGLAMVYDASTFDGWTVVDSTRWPGPTSDLVLPVPAGAPAGSTFDAWITNASSSQATVTIGATATPVKRRAVRRNANAPPLQQQSVTLAAGETRRMTLTNTPFVHISGPVGAIGASGRLTTTAAGRSGAFGTGVPAIPASRALAAGSGARHFFRANDLPNVSPPALLLVETAGRPATVRVTASFNFPAGSTVSAHVEESKDYDVAPGQMLTISDLLRSVIVQRDSFGELANLVVDVEVVGGDGRVLPYFESVDKSGDLTLTGD